MRPYKRTHKPIRYCENYLIGRWFGRTCKAIGSLCKDIQSIWFREPPFPASVRILFSVLLIWILLLPLLYFLIPPLMTIASFYILKCEEIPIFAELPPLPAPQKQMIVKAVKELFKKATFKVSMLVTLYDYVQTFRALEMNNPQPKFRPFTCYFCRKLIENDTEFGHNSNCGMVLEPCPNKCGLYVPRNMRSAHLRECANIKLVSKSRGSYSNSADETYSYNTNSLDRKKNKHAVFQIHNTTTDQMYKELSQNFAILRSKQQELVHVQNNNQLQTKMLLEKLYLQNQILTEWRKTVEIQLKNVKKDVHVLQTDQLEKQSMASQSNLLKLESNFGSLNQQLHHNQLENREIFNDFQTKLREFNDRFVQENAAVAALWNDHKMNINSLVDKTENLSKTQNEAKNKQSSLNFDLKSVIQTSGETSDKVEIQQRLLAEMKQELNQLKTDYRSLEESSTSELCKHFLQFPGRFLWKIDNFQTKMDNAKENNTFLKSPIFYTHDFGYKVRLHLYLNGIKKWKGRHAIICLHVLKGEYDLLLKWPCYIEGTLVLRDLYNHSNPVDFSKYILAKRHSGDEEDDEPQESSTQFIFIPHTTLTKQNFLRENTLFIELQIISTNRNKDETEL